MDKLVVNAEKEIERLLLEMIKESPFKGVAWTVGGFVRDDLLGVESKDIDIVVQKKNGAEDLSKYLKQMFPDNMSTPYNLGKSYPIWHIDFKEDIVYKEKIFKTSGGGLDIADTQKESFPDPKTRQRITEYGSIEEDILRRDLTINMLLRDLTSGDIIDFTGTSLNDLKKGILRGHPKVDFNKILSDDPLRILRLIRFYCKYDWDIPLSVLKIVKNNVKRIEIISGERIRDELIKIMLLGKLHVAIKFMKVVGLLKIIFPEVYDLIGVEQSKAHHSEGHCFIHTLLTLSKAKPTVEAQLSALFHDLGKKKTFEKVDNNTFHYYGHEDVSEELTEVIMRRLSFDLDLINRVKKIVKNHMRAHYSNEWGIKAVRRYVRDLTEGIDVLESVLDLTDIDARSSIRPNGLIDTKVPALRERIAKTTLEVPIRKKPLLSGYDIMNLLGIQQGKIIGDILKFIEDKEDTFADSGKILSKEEAEILVKKSFSFI